MGRDLGRWVLGWYGGGYGSGPGAGPLCACLRRDDVEVALPWFAMARLPGGYPPDSVRPSGLNALIGAQEGGKMAFVLVLCGSGVEVPVAGDARLVGVDGYAKSMS